MTSEISRSTNFLFHYTSLDSAIKIIYTGRLKFGRFENTNDIAEIRRETYDGKDSETLGEILTEYQSISFTYDCQGLDRGFAIDCLWGYYAQKGNGVCLVFDRDKILSQYNALYQIQGVPLDKRISYIENFTNLIISSEEHDQGISDFVKNNLSDIFYTKDKCWEHEREIRLLACSQTDQFLPIGDSLVGAIICVPHEIDYTKSIQYIVLKSLQSKMDFKIYHYTTNFGNKQIIEEGNVVWPILGIDYKIDDTAFNV